MSNRQEQETETKLQLTKHFLRAQILGRLPYPTQKFSGQTIIVTGANTGLGKEAARHFVRLDAAKVILACRSVEKGKAAAEDIRQSESKTGVVEAWELDLASYDSTKRFARRAIDELQRLDVVVANAGVYLYDFKKVEEDEETITVNVVSTFLLGLLLLPKLRATALAHNKETVLTFVGSLVHQFTDFPEADAMSIFGELSNLEKARMADRYNVSKAMQLFIMRELASRLSESDHPSKVNTSIINPGFVVTNIMRHNTTLAYNAFMAVLRKLAGRTAEQGSRTLVFAAYGGEERHGKYLDDDTVGKVAPYIVSESGHRTQDKLWRELSAKLERIEPGIMSNV